MRRLPSCSSTLLQFEHLVRRTMHDMTTQYISSLFTNASFTCHAQATSCYCLLQLCGGASLSTLQLLAAQLLSKCVFMFLFLLFFAVALCIFLFVINSARLVVCQLLLPGWEKTEKWTLWRVLCRRWRSSFFKSEGRVRHRQQPLQPSPGLSSYINHPSLSVFIVAGASGLPMHDLGECVV